MQNKLDQIRVELSKVIVWQDDFIRDMLICLFSWWHILIEWVPGLAKTLWVSSLAKVADLSFNRIQFTPDLLPSDLIWSRIYNPDKKEFFVEKWPIFSNLVLADEINRAPSKLQSALLESMAESQVTIWENSFILDKPFMVLATQNPIEQDWTYDLPEAWLDRFLLKTILDYPNKSEEIQILKNNTSIENINLEKIINKQDILEIQKDIEKIFVDDSIFKYISNLSDASRNNSSLKKYIEFWVSPRASICLFKSAKTLAYMSWRDNVIPEDIKEMIFPVYRHRLILNYEAISNWVSSDEVISKILDKVKV